MHEPTRLLLSTTSNGQVSRCLCCQEIELVYGNIMITFTEHTIAEFTRFIEGLDVEQLLAANQMLLHARRVLVQLPPTRVRMAFRVDEVDELRQLLRSSVQVIQSMRLTGSDTAGAFSLN